MKVKGKLIIAWVFTAILSITLWQAACLCVCFVEAALRFHVGGLVLPVAAQFVSDVIHHWWLVVHLPSGLIAVACVAGGFLETRGVHVSKTSFLVVVAVVTLIIVFTSVAALLAPFDAPRLIPLSQR